LSSDKAVRAIVLAIVLGCAGSSACSESADRSSSVSAGGLSDSAVRVAPNENPQPYKESESPEDAVTRQALDNGAFAAGIFRRSSRWRAVLCAVSDAGYDAGWLGTRSGNASFSVWEKVKGKWQRAGYSAGTQGLIRADKMKCASEVIPKAGTFFVQVHTPEGRDEGVNFRLTVTGGGRELEMSRIR
jgi:hypothetical protein